MAATPQAVNLFAFRHRLTGQLLGVELSATESFPHEGHHHVAATLSTMGDLVYTCETLNAAEALRQSAKAPRDRETHQFIETSVDHPSDGGIDLAEYDIILLISGGVVA